MQRPLISVLVPFYNMEAHLEEAVRSVIGQTYTHWELHLVDDGSTDGATRIAKQFVADFPGQIHYHIHENFRNRGLAQSRNEGLRHARGDYVALLDADDVWLPHKLERQVAIVERHPECALVAGASEYWHSWARPSEPDQVIRVGGTNDRPVAPPAFVHDLYPLGAGSAPCTGSMLIKTDVLRKHEGFVEQFSGIYQMYEDQAFLVKLYLNEPVYMSSECLDRYRQRPGSLVHGVRERGEYAKVRGFYLNWLAEYLDAQNIQNPMVRERLARAKHELAHPTRYRLKRLVTRIARRLVGKRG